jgi:hypothetical protein
MNNSDVLLKHPLKDYFQYHPVLTEERKAKHDRANKESLDLCQGLWDLLDLEGDRIDRANDFIKLYSMHVGSLFNDPLAKIWFFSSIDEILVGVGMLDRQNILQSIQLCRMFANQGITLDSLEVPHE